MTIHWPQVVIGLLLLMRAAQHINKNGEQREETYEGGSAIVSAIIWFGLLYAGGFWTGAQ